MAPEIFGALDWELSTWRLRRQQWFELPRPAAVELQFLYTPVRRVHRGYR